MAFRRLKPPKGYRIYLCAMGCGQYSLSIKKNGRQIYAPSQLSGMREDCREQAMKIILRNEIESPDSYVF